MSDLVLDASLALQWFLEDESGRQYGLGVIASLSSKRAVVPIMWCQEVGNGPLMAYRRKRITFDQIDGFLTRLKSLPIDAAQQVPTEILELPAIAQKHSLTNQEAAYLALAMRFLLPLARTDAELRRAAAAAGVAIVAGQLDREHPNWQHGLSEKLGQLLKTGTGFSGTVSLPIELTLLDTLSGYDGRQCVPDFLQPHGANPYRNRSSAGTMTVYRSA